MRIRSNNEIISSLIDFFRVAQPNLDTKPGTVSRDLFVEGVSAQIARLYDELNRVSTLQSLRIALGIDLDRLAANFGQVRGIGSKATVPALYTFSSIDSDIPINKGEIVTAKNGATFVVLNNQTVSSVLANQYRATATKFRGDLDFLGISDNYAVEILLEATAPGIQGNISKYTLKTTSTAGVASVTNVVASGGGRSAEDDGAFRNRVLSIFSGANTGTALGYENAARADSSVIDVIVIEPGSVLMTRDGTQVFTDSSGVKTILSEGSGGKVDILVYGIRIQETSDSFIYRDLSNTGDPTNSKNDFVVGQILDDADKTITQKRLDNLKTKILPTQPVNNFISVSGSLSGSNFIAKSVDSLGRITGNYELIRNVGANAGSPWGRDSLHWLTDRIENFVEDETKLQFNGQDSLGYSDVLRIGPITQNISVVNENSSVVPSDRTFIQLAHKPVSNVTRVFNVITGERYVITNQNPDGTGTVNFTGRINISGKSLPAISDILQVDYTWVFTYDSYFDFDNKVSNNNIRVVQDSVDWGISNAVRREPATLINGGSFLTTTTTHPISTVISVNIFDTDDGNIGLISSRLSLIVTNEVKNVVSIIRNSDNAEMWVTNKLDGTFSGQTIYFPTDTPGQYLDTVSVVYNAVDVYNADNIGSFNDNIITIVPSTDATAGKLTECNYISNITNVLPTTLLPSLPAVRSGNYFNTISSNGVGNQPTSHMFSSPGIVSNNLRQAPSNLGLTIAGSISPGVITITGTTITGVLDIVYTVSTAGLKQDLSAALKNVLNLNSKTTLPTNIRIAKISKVELVSTTTNLDVLSIDHTYDIRGYKLYDNTFVKSESISDSSLKITEFVLPQTSDNNSNMPIVGNRIKISFYYITSLDSENVSFSKSGTLYTNKKFALVDTIAISGGFTSSNSSAATLTVFNLNQPATKSRYKTTYDYLAPKTNERITIDYNYDRLISDVTLAVENTRPINADVLVKSAIPVLINVTMKISVTEDFKNNTKIVLQNVVDAITVALNANQLGTKIDSSDLVNQAYTVNGLDSARITLFNKDGKEGSVLKIQAQQNEFLQANTVIVQLES